MNNTVQYPCLIVVNNGIEGTVFPLEHGENLIGRWDPEAKAFPEVDLSNEDAESKISRKHALLHYESGQFAIEDIGSRNGTFLKGGQQLSPGVRHPLSHNEDVVVGKTVIRLKLHE